MLNSIATAQVSKDVTGIIVCTTHHTHFDIGTKALNLGLFALCCTDLMPFKRMACVDGKADGH